MIKFTVELADTEVKMIEHVRKIWNKEDGYDDEGHSIEYVIATLAATSAYDYLVEKGRMKKHEI